MFLFVRASQTVFKISFLAGIFHGDLAFNDLLIFYHSYEISHSPVHWCCCWNQCDCVCCYVHHPAGLLVNYFFTHKKAGYTAAEGKVNVQTTIQVGPVYENVSPAPNEEIELNTN